MRKILSKIAGLMLGLSLAVGVGVAVGSRKVGDVKAAPSTETFSHSDIAGMATAAAASTSGTYSVFTITVDGITSSGYNASESVRVYKGASITISSSGGNITSATITCTANGTTKYGPGSFTGTGYTAGSAKTGTWTGDASSFTLTASENQGRISDFSITYTGGETETYTVSFNGNGASGSMSDVTDVVGSYTLPSNGFTVPSGQVFTGWKANNTGSILAAGSSYTVTDDVEFYAQWANAYSVTYTAGANGTGSYVHSLQPAGIYTLLQFAELSGIAANTGYRFANYTVGGVTKNAGESVTISAATSVTVNFEVKPVESTYDFTKKFSTYSSAWSGYGTHEGLDGITDIGGDYASTIDMYYVSKQTGTITDRPVFASKTASGSWAKVLQFTLTESGYKIDSIVVTFAQWSSKTPDVALFKGNSASGSTLDTATIGTKNTLSASDFNGTVFTIGYCDKNGSSNVQSGLTSIYITLVPLASFGTLDHITITALPNVVYHVGETFDSTGLEVTAYDGADEGTANFKDVTSSVVTDLDNPSAFVDGDVPGFDCDVSYSGDGGSDTKSFHVYVYALAEYELVSSDLEDWSGQYLIVGTDGESNLVAMNGGLSNPDVEANFKTVSATDNVIEAGQELEWTVAKISGGYSIQGKSGKYISSLTSKNNGMAYSDTALLNTIEYSGSASVISGQNSDKYQLAFNTTGNRFRYYASGTVQLYKLKTSDKADEYAQLFLSAFTCDSTGENAPTFTIKEGSTYWSWSLLETEYDTLTSVEKEAFRLGVPSQTGTNIEKAIARYDLVVRKYGWDNFMQRSVASGAPYVQPIANNNSSTIIIVVVALTSITSIGVLLVIKRKRSLVK